MARFRTQLLTFVLLLLFLMVVAVAGSRYYMASGHFYTVKPETTSLILGHSQTECALNDALIANTENFSMGGEAYLYTYQKVKKLLEENPQVKTIYVSFANNQVERKMNQWTWGNEPLYSFFPRYSYLMAGADYRVLLAHNAATVLEGQAKAFKEFLSFAAARKKSCLAGRNWGGYLYLERQKVDSLLGTDYLKKQATNHDSLSTVNIAYLKKIVACAKKHHVQLVLVRMPVHPLCPMLSNEAVYQGVRQREFGSVPYVDFRAFRAAPQQMGDFEHLNHLGADRFSKLFDSLQQAGVFTRASRQQEVDDAIARNNKKAGV